MTEISPPLTMPVQVSPSMNPIQRSIEWDPVARHAFRVFVACVIGIALAYKFGVAPEVIVMVLVLLRGSEEVLRQKGWLQ